MDSSDERMPYLRAIQKVPGDTASEKLSWLSRCAHHQTGENQVPPELLPLYRVEVAVKTKNYEEITSALKSENLTLVNRALKAAWFFDGSHKKIIDDVYFVEHIFPYVSAIARKRIVSALAYRTIGRDPEFAQRMFTVVMSLYDIQTSYPLLLASGEEFAYETIVKEEHALPCRILKKMWRAYPNFVIRYLKMLPPQPHNSRVNRLPKPFGVTIHKYKSFLPSLVKTRTEDFAELCVINRRSLPHIQLSKTAAEVFLKKAQSYFVKNPQLFIDMLPLKKINAELMKTVFSSLLPKEKYNFKTDRMLEYLEYYPKDKKWELLYKSYKMAYSAELTASTDNVTFELLRVVPAGERVNLARRLLGDNITSKNDCEENYEKCLICYLPTDEALPVFKEKIKYTSHPKDRHCYILHMLYNCKINDDNDALADTLEYFLQRHKNEDATLLDDTIARIQQFFDVPRLNEKLCSSIFEILQLRFVNGSAINEKLAKDLVHHRLIHGMPITDLIEMIINVGFTKFHVTFNMLTKYPGYERHCLLSFLEVIRDQHKRPYKNFYEQCNVIRLVEAMYAFNDRCQKSKTKMEHMTIMDYPWLIDSIRYHIRDRSFTHSISFMSNRLKFVLKTKERKLYDELIGEEKTEKEIRDVTSGKLLRLLTQNPQSIANDWQTYFGRCSGHWRNKFVQRFVKATRWYKYIPIAFAEHCVEILEDDISKQETQADLPFATVALSLLLHGDSLTKVIDPLLPTEKNMDVKNPDMRKRYELIKWLCRGINLSNPPVPLDLVARMCRGDCLSFALWSVTSISRRSSIPKVEAFARNLLSMRIGTRKHGITVNSVISGRQQIDFYQEMWRTEKHRSIRDVLFNSIHKLFAKTPTPETWNLYAGAISTLNDEDEGNQLKPVDDIPDEYIDKYMKVWFDMLDKVTDTRTTIIQYLCSLMNKSVCDLVSEELIEDVLKAFLFYETEISENVRISIYAKHVAIAYLSPNNKNELAPRIKMVMDIILNAIRNRWDIRDSVPSYYTLNTAVRELIFSLVCRPAIDMQVIDNMLTIFSIVPPVQLSKSYLLLTYAKRMKRNCTPQEARDFGLKLGQEITDIPFFSPLLVSYLADVLDHFLMTCVDRWILYRRETSQPTEDEAVCDQLQSKPAQSAYEVKLNVVEGLIEASNSHSSFIALEILKKGECEMLEHIQKYNELVEKFRKMQEHPASMTIVYDHFRKVSLTSEHLTNKYIDDDLLW